MSVELVHRKPSEATERRCVRMMGDAIALSLLSRAEIRAVYDKLECARDALSRILDRADGKDA